MFTTTHALNLRKLEDAVKKHYNVLSSEPALPAEFKNPPLIVCRRGCNVRDKLARANCQPQKKTRLFYAPYRTVAINAEVAHSAII